MTDTRPSEEELNRLSVIAQPASSPTGAPVLPVAFGPIASALAAIATAIVTLTPEYTWAHRIALGLLGLSSVFGIGSVGWRKK